MTTQTSGLRIAVAQANFLVGDVAGNARKIAELLSQAEQAGADLLVTPELALSGYPPEDLLLRDDFLQRCADALDGLRPLTRHVGLVIGHPRRQGDATLNSASFIADGQVLAVYDKQRLPNYEVFDEHRYFQAGHQPCVVEFRGVHVGLNICADVWTDGAAERARRAGAEVLVVLNASPFHLSKQDERLATLRARQRHTGMAILYVNMVGGQDELVFDGGSMALDADGALAYQAPQFSECLDVVSYAAGCWQGGSLCAHDCEEAQVYQALVTGVRDYIGKSGFPGAIIGLSGGIDSALVLCIAVDALGADRVRAVMMPSPYTAQMSLDDARALARTLGVRYDEIAISPAMDLFADLLAPQFTGLPADTTEENLQSRIRGMILMALSNKTGALVLTTGNKSEMATGYATLYGDMAGGFAVIKDVLKTLVYRISRWVNREREIIPENIIVRPPSAELRPDQCDQDSLPPYEVLDAILEAYMERNASPQEIIGQGLPEEEVYRVLNMLRRNEYKRRQAPVGVRITRRGFGRDWRYPITSGFRHQP